MSIPSLCAHFLSYQRSNRCKCECAFFICTQLKNLFIFRPARILTFANISHLELCKYQKNARAFTSITELIAQKARTLWGNVHSCTKLFNMLNTRRWWHEWRKSQNTTPHTWRISLRQESRVTLTSADSSSVRRPLYQRSNWIFDYIRNSLLKGSMEISKYPVTLGLILFQIFFT